MLAPPSLHVDARLALLHGADHLGAELLLEPLRHRLGIGGAQVDVIPRVIRHGAYSPCLLALCANSAERYDKFERRCHRPFCRGVESSQRALSGTICRSREKATEERHAGCRNCLNGAYAELPGVKLWFTDSGGSGVPIVLLHPNTGTVEIWQPQIAAFAAAGYRVIAFDRKGWGKSLADPASGAAARQHRRRSRCARRSSQARKIPPARRRRRWLHRARLCGVAPGKNPQPDRRRFDGKFRGQRDRRFHRPHRHPRDQETVGALPGNRRVLSWRQPGRHQALDRNRRARAPAGRGLSAAAAHAEHVCQDRGHYRADAGGRRRCRSPGAAGLDAHLGGASAPSRMGRHSRCRPRHGLGAARRVQRQGFGFFAAALTDLSCSANAEHPVNTASAVFILAACDYWIIRRSLSSGRPLRAGPVGG